MGEPDVDGDAASFLFREAVAVDPRECLHERRLAVVDVPGRAEDQVAGHAETVVDGRERVIALYASWPAKWGSPFRAISINLREQLTNARTPSARRRDARHD